MRKVWISAGVVAIAMGFLACGGAGGGGGGITGGGSTPDSVILAGSVYDSVSGNAVSDVRIRFGARSTTSAPSDGSFELSFADSPDGVSGPFTVCKSGYQFLLVDSLTLTAGSDLDLRIPLVRNTYSSYATVTGRVYTADDSEIPSGSELTFLIFGSNGTRDVHQEVTYSGGFSFQSALVSSDCLVVVIATLTDGTQIAVFSDGVPFPGSGTISMNGLTATESAFNEITLTASTVGNIVSGAYVSKYGQVPVLFQDPSEPGTLTANLAALSISSSVKIFNPVGWNQVLWNQTEQDVAFNAAHPGHHKTYSAVSAVSVSLGTVILPSLDRTLGPFGVATPSSLAYVSPVLAQDPVDGADWYMYTMRGNDSNGAVLGTVWASESDIVLPSEVVDLVGGNIIYTSYSIACMSASPEAILEGLCGVWAPNFALSFLQGAAVTYENSFEVPFPGTIGIGLQ